jgi:hypothetical protein
MLRRRLLPISSGLARRVIAPRSTIRLPAYRLQSTTAAATELPKASPLSSPPPRRRNGWRRLFRYTWRVVYISALGGFGYFIYSTFNPPLSESGLTCRCLCFSASASKSTSTRSEEENVGYPWKWMGKYKSS